MYIQVCGLGGRTYLCPFGSILQSSPTFYVNEGVVGGGCLNRVVTNAVASNDGHTTRGSGSSRR